MSFTAAEKKACADREVQMRERVYPRWVETGKMRQRLADHELAVMREIAADYERLAGQERLL